MVVDKEVDERVAILDNLRLEDDQPNIEAPAVAVACDTNMGFNFQDRNAYDTHWIDETVAMEKLVCFMHVIVHFSVRKDQFVARIFSFVTLFYL
jgi:hypothetical protein